MKKTPFGKRNAACCICDNARLKKVIDLPKLPLTGLYFHKKNERPVRPYDQGLLLCERCGHAQLEYSLDPNILYDRTYTHRTSESPIASKGNEFFVRFLESLVGDKRFERVVDIGCNDLVLLKLLAPRAKQLLGVDPIWRDREPPPQWNIRVLGRFIEEIDLRTELRGAADLVVSTHTFEHIAEPKRQFQKLVAQGGPDTLYVIEVPGFDTLLETERFDQVFHQHIQHYSLASFERLLRELGCRMVGHAFNHDFWGGTMLVAFQRSSRTEIKTRFLKPTVQRVARGYKSFRAQLQRLMETVRSLKGVPMHGYGAAQMLPVLAYHMRSDLSFLDNILDDDARRDGLRYPDLAPGIVQPGSDLSLEGRNVLITALDSARPILRRVMTLRPKRILLPLRIL